MAMSELDPLFIAMLRMMASQKSPPHGVTAFFQDLDMPDL